MTDKVAGPDGSALSEGLGHNAEDDECSAPPRVTDAPADLWLVYGDLDRDATHWECCRGGDVAWCEDKQYDSDVHYVRGDRYDDLHTVLLALVLAHDTLQQRNFSGGPADYEQQRDALRQAWAAARVALVA